MKRLDPIAYADPLHAGRHPFQTFLLALCVVSGIPLLFGEQPAQSVETLLPAWIAMTWGWSLAGGALVALVGSYWPRSNYATALTIERIGLIIVGPAALLYATVLMLYAGLAATVAAAITLGFGAACIKRGRDVGKIIQRAIPEVDSAPIRRENEAAADATLRDDEEQGP